MKNDIKKYLTLGAVLAGSALMVSCDGDDVTIVEDSGVADAITAGLGPKAIAPVSLASFPITSLKLAFDNDAGTCLGAAFVAGDEVEIDFDSTTATASGDISGNAIGDLDDTNGSFIANDGNVFIEGITADPAAATWTVDFVKEGTDATGNVLLSDLTFTPLASNQQSVSGRFTATAPVDVNFNQATNNVVGDTTGNDPSDNLTLPNGDSANIISVTVYRNDGANLVEVISTDGTSQFETTVGDGNYAISLGADDGCVYNFVVNQAAVIALANITDEADLSLLDISEANDIIGLVDFDNTLDVSPEGNQIATSEADVRYLNAGTSNSGVAGSYRHDFDSSTGASEPDVNQAD